jgi:hypothetical protein
MEMPRNKSVGVLYSKTMKRCTVFLSSLLFASALLLGAPSVSAAEQEIVWRSLPNDHPTIIQHAARALRSLLSLFSIPFPFSTKTARAQTCIPPPGPKEQGESCGGGSSGPPHTLGPTFCANCCTGSTVSCDDGTIQGCCDGFCKVTGCDARDSSGNCIDPHEVPVCPHYSCKQQCENEFGIGTPYLWDSITGQCGCEPGGTPPPPPGRGTIGGKCADSNNDGKYDRCDPNGTSNVSCNTDADCTRNRHTVCGGTTNAPTCEVAEGPGINECGPAWNPDSSLCLFECPSPTKTNCPGSPPLNNLCSTAFNGPNANFGNPTCDFSKERLTQLLKQLDPDFFDKWLDIIACESSFNPNNHRKSCEQGGPSPCTPDPQGAWGLFQMGSCEGGQMCNPDETCPGRNGIFDRGDLCWRRQVFNAVNYRRIKNSFAYWGCAQ